MNSERVLRSLKVLQKVDEGYWVLSVKCLALYLDADRIAHLLRLRCHFIIVSVQFVSETVQTTVNDCLVRFIHWYQRVEDGLGILPFVYQRRWRAMMTAASMVPTLLLAAKAIMSVYMSLIRRCKDNVRLRIWLFIVGYVHLGTRRSPQVHLRRPEFVSRLCLVTHDCFFWHVSVVIHSSPLEGALLNVAFINVGH